MQSVRFMSCRAALPSCHTGGLWLAVAASPWSCITSWRVIIETSKLCQHTHTATEKAQKGGENTAAAPQTACVTHTGVAAGQVAVQVAQCGGQTGGDGQRGMVCRVTGGQHSAQSQCTDVKHTVTPFQPVPVLLGRCRVILRGTHMWQATGQHRIRQCTWCTAVKNGTIQQWEHAGHGSAQSSHLLTSFSIKNSRSARLPGCNDREVHCQVTA